VPQDDKVSATPPRSGGVQRRPLTPKAFFSLALLIAWFLAPAGISLGAGLLQSMDSPALLNLADWARPVTAPVIGLFDVPSYRGTVTPASVPDWPSTPVFGQPTAMHQMVQIWTGNILPDRPFFPGGSDNSDSAVGPSSATPAPPPDWIKIHDLVITTDFACMAIQLLVVFLLLFKNRARRKAQVVPTVQQLARASDSDNDKATLAGLFGMFLVALVLYATWHLFQVTGTRNDLEVDRYRHLRDFSDFLFSAGKFFTGTTIALQLGVIIIWAASLGPPPAKALKR
jgi:hypothetical protein